jgi:hypothetical protein
VNETELAEHFHAAVAEVPAHTTIDLDRAIAAGGRRARRRRARTLALSMLLIPAILVGAFDVVRGAQRPAGNVGVAASAKPTGTEATATSFVGHTYVSVAWISAGQPRFAGRYHASITFDANNLSSGPGCSGVSGSYQVEGNRLVTGRLIMLACADARGEAHRVVECRRGPRDRATGRWLRRRPRPGSPNSAWSKRRSRENRRETWALERAQVTIDHWPGLALRGDRGRL